jgi:S1-C subfamily serine protease
MKKKVLIILGIATALVTTFIIGAAAGGGMIYTWLHQVQPASAAQATEPDPDDGLIVTFVEEDGPASKAGVVRGDILLRIDDHEVNNMFEVRDILEDLEVGDDVKLTVLHGDELRSLNVTLAEGSPGVRLGLSLCCGRTSPLKIKAEEINHGKPLIIRVQKDSPADEAGLQPGDLILSIDGEEIDSEKSLPDWISQYEPGDQIQLEVHSLNEDQTREVIVELGEHPEKEGEAYMGVFIFQAPRELHLFGEGDFRYEFHFDFPPQDEEDFPFHFFDGDGWIRPFIGSGFESGIIIMEVKENTPASKAGIEEGDIITALDGEDIEGSRSLADTISAMQPGDVISIAIYRPSSDETLELEITLGGHPEDPEVGYLGVQIRGTIRMGHFDEGERYKRWLPFPNKFYFPFELEERFQLPGSEGV